MTPTLLLADDSVTIQRVIELTFANENVRVVSTSDGDAALRQISAERPDIVLADVGMPKMDGYEVATHIKNSPQLRDIPVLLLTGAFDPIDEIRARASGCDGILVKPFEPQQVLGRVKELLAGHRTAALWPAILPKGERGPAPAEHPSSTVSPPVESVGRPAGAPQGPPAAAGTLGPVAIPAQAAPPAELRPTVPDLDVNFQRDFDELDAVLADLDQKTAVSGLDEETASDFARDLDMIGSAEPAKVSRPFGDWDLPAPPLQTEPMPSATVGPLESRTRNVKDLATPDAKPGGASPSAPSEIPGPEPFAATRSKLSMASAFSALLAAEQALPAQGSRPAPGPSLTEAAVEDIVRRVLGRMTEETVRRIVLETAERLIKEEIEKIRANPT